MSTASDVFSFGCLLWEIFEQSPPWPTLSGVEAAQAVRRGQRMRSAKASPSNARLMAQCWAHDRAARPAAATLAAALKPIISQYDAPLPPRPHVPQGYDETRVYVKEH